jgi:hypothetical protein
MNSPPTSTQDIGLVGAELVIHVMRAGRIGTDAPMDVKPLRAAVRVVL